MFVVPSMYRASVILRMNRASDRGRDMADDKKPDVKPAGGEDTPAPKKRVAKKKAAKKTAKKKTTKKKAIAKKTAKKKVVAKNVVKKAPAAPVPVLESAVNPLPTSTVAPAHAVKPQATVPAGKPPVPAEHAEVQQHLKQMDKSEKGQKSIKSPSEGSQPAAPHSFWPKVIVWVIVILVGFMFVRSLAKKDAVEEQTETMAPAVEQQAAPEIAAAVAEKPSEVQTKPIPIVPVEKAAEVVPASEKAEAAPHAEPAPAVTDKASEPASPTPAVSAPKPPVPAQAAVEPAPAAPPIAAAPAQAAAAPAPATVQQTAPVAPSKGSRHHQLMAKYEAMRKAAQEERRKMYERIRQRPMQAPWGHGQGQRPYYGNPYYSTPYQPWGSN